MRYLHTFKLLMLVTFAAIYGCSGEQKENNQTEESGKSEEVSYSNILDFLRGKNDYSIFTDAIYKYSFDTVLLKDDVSYTVIVLTDIAPEKIPLDIRMKLDADTAASRAYLSRHIIPQAVLVEGDTAMDAVALSGEHIILRKDSQHRYFANDVPLLHVFKAGKDVVYTTDSLLVMPE